MSIWAITRMLGNPITGRGGGVNEMAIAVEAMQGIFIGLAAALLAIESRNSSSNNNRRRKADGQLA
jgi:hypothetical protein